MHITSDCSRGAGRVCPPVSSVQTVALVALRTLVGWHFLYEGYYKAFLPGWARGGQPLGSWSAAGYLENATGPMAGFFHSVAVSPAGAWIDPLVVAALIAVGLSLLLGLFTDLGCVLALGLLTMFYLAHPPLAGIPQPGAEGTYLLVNKTLVEWASVLVLIVFRTGRLAGLDRLWGTRARREIVDDRHELERLGKGRFA